jgi:predicted PurR-regulated permease PerM
MNSPQIQRGAFLLLLAAVTVAFVWILVPFGGAILWGVALAILFTPLYKRLLRKMPRYPTGAALLTLLICLLIVILPLAMVTGSLANEVAQITQRVRSGQINFADYFRQIVAALPGPLVEWAERFNLGDIGVWQQRIATALGQASQLIASQALAIGQNTFDFFISFFLMLYLLFFLMRDGQAVTNKVRHAVPLSSHHANKLLDKFTTVIRATVKGNIAVAATQGALGGLAFWVLDVEGALLWAVLMGFLSLLPAVGAALIWLPVALYFLATGAIWQGVALIAYGVMVIGLVDNVLRPILVGKDTKMPDYIVLLSTLGGMALFGINGFVIGPVVAALFIASWGLFAEVDGDDDEFSAPPRR